MEPGDDILMEIDSLTLKIYECRGCVADIVSGMVSHRGWLVREWKRIRQENNLPAYAVGSKCFKNP